MNIKTLLKNKEKTIHLQGDNVRLFWQDSVDIFDGKITDANKAIVCAGWHVITWKRSKAVTLYFGMSFNDALKVFDSYNS